MHPSDAVELSANSMPPAKSVDSREKLTFNQIGDVISMSLCREVDDSCLAVKLHIDCMENVTNAATIVILDLKNDSI